MTWDTVPWFTGGTAQHSPEVARVLAYAAFNANEGVLGVDDLKVAAQTTPAGSVKISPGVASIISRASGQTYQTYAGRNPTQDTIAIAATGAGVTRRDMVIARVEDPNLAGEPWSNPANPIVGPYIFTRVVSNVASTVLDVDDLNLGYTAIALALITIPPSTSAITNAMITDLRVVANPRTKRFLRAMALAGGSADDICDNSGAPGESFPNQIFTMTVPPWAANARVIGQWVQVKVPANSGAYGALWVRLRTPSSSVIADTQVVSYNSAASPSAARNTYICADDIPIPAGLRGIPIVVELRGRKDSGATPGAQDIRVDPVSAFSVDIQFYEKGGQE